jgi:hypothetical protein
MATLSAAPRSRRLEGGALLKNGDELDQKTFHQRYEASPRGFFLGREVKRFLAVLRLGLASQEHAAFVARLQEQQS